MDFWLIVRKRFMCRSYLDRDVPKEVLDRILEVVDHLPSAGHTQPQEFIVIRNQNPKERLAIAALGQRYVTEANIHQVTSGSMTRKFSYSFHGVKLDGDTEFTHDFHHQGWRYLLCILTANGPDRSGE